MLYSLDIETTGLDSFKDAVLVVGVYTPATGYLGMSLEEFRAWHKESNGYVCHNGAFDINFLRRHGVDVSPSFRYDTRSIASILIPSPKLAEGQKNNLGLENLAMVLLNAKSYKLDRTRMSEYTKQELEAYNAEDCKLTFRLFEYLIENIPPQSWEFVENWIMPATKLCAELEYNGIYGDWSGLREYEKEVRAIRERILVELNQETKQAQQHWKEIQRAELKKKYAARKEAALAKSKDPAKRSAFYDKLFTAAASKIPDFNWNSPSQLVWLLKDYYCLDLLNKRTEKETTQEEKLKELDHLVAKKLVEFREVEKLLNQQFPALLDNVKADQCVHGRFMVGGTRTGRLSSSEPNLQQISARKPIGRKIRSFIQARPGHKLVTIDYAQIEPRLLAHASQELSLLSAFRDGVDIYSVFAQKIFSLESADLKTFKTEYPVERACGKTGGLSVIYGTGPNKFAEMVRKETGKDIKYKQAKELVENFRANMPKVGELKSKLERGLANGKTYYNLLGRPFYIESNDDLYMKGLNTFIQGSASDLVMYSQISMVAPWLRESKISHTYRLMVHDEVVIELPEDGIEEVVETIEKLMTREIEKQLSLTVPLKVEYSVSKVWQKA